MFRTPSTPSGPGGTPRRLLSGAVLALSLVAPLGAQRAFRVKDIGPGATGSAQRSFACANGLLFFDASDGLHGVEPWRSDGTELGTFQLADAHPSGSSSPNGWTAFDGAMYFVAFDPTRGEELWKSDGTTASLFIDLANGFLLGPYSLCVVGSELFFAANGNGDGFELWKTDGTVPGTVQVADVWAGATGSLPDHLTDVEGTLFFSARDDVTGDRNLWKSDGTAPGTAMVKSFAGDGAPQDLVPVGSTLFFTANTPAFGRELWKSDGTSAGTTVVADVYPGSNGSQPSELVVLDGVLYFTAYEPTGGREVWRSDGTGAGTFRVADVNSGATSAEPNGLVAVGSELFFAATEPVGGQELWSTDGTALGTHRVKDIDPGAASGLGAGFFFSYLTSGWDVLLFAADDGVSGTELWRTDGREGGTLQVQDVLAGPGSSMAHLEPYGTAACGPWLFFLADDGTSGVELWATDWTFGDGFEAGDLSAWSSVVDPSGDLSVNGGAALEGSFGLEVRLGGGVAPRYVEDDSPAGGERYRAAFRIDASGLTWRGGAIHPGGASGPGLGYVRVLTAVDASGALVASVELELSPGSLSLRARSRDDSGAFQTTPPVALAPGPHAVELDRRRASGDGANDGSLELFLDGASVGAIAGLDDDERSVQIARFGAVTSWPGAGGSYLIDDFESRRVLPIGR